MTIEKKIIKVKDLIEGYVDDTETDIEKGVYAYGGKLCVRPAFQRSFVYNTTQENAVIDTTLKGFPLNIMYWVDNCNGTYDCLDGQQRTISLCKFADGLSSYIGNAITDVGKIPERINIRILKRLGLLEKFYDYELEVYICKGTKAEQLEWFRVVNIAGEKLYDQELRNASYVSVWLTAAKKYFSRASVSKKCPAERIAEKYTNKNANRQELLEQAIIWACNSSQDSDICNYMENHMNDSDANELINFFNDVINWVKNLFPNIEDKAMKTINWGSLYHEYKDEDFNIEEIDKIYNELIEKKVEKKLDTSAAKIIEYCITRDSNLLKSRTFNEHQKTVLYERQHHICPDCNRQFLKRDMVAHHIIPWYDGGDTELTNGIMLCKECHTRRHAEEHCPY